MKSIKTRIKSKSMSPQCTIIDQYAYFAAGQKHRAGMQGTHCHKTNKDLTSFKMLVFFVCVITVVCSEWSSGISLFTALNSPANIWKPRTLYYSDMELLSKYSPVTLHPSPATRILNENPGFVCFFFCFPAWYFNLYNMTDQL